jgi:GT2 family glycosyltransferase
MMSIGVAKRGRTARRRIVGAERVADPGPDTADLRPFGPAGPVVPSASELPLISVLMPVRNEERHILSAIEAVLAQRVPLELLIIDGASTDRTVELVQSVTDDRVQLLSNPARTIPAALNIGLASARGSMVARIDAHARVNGDYLRNGLRHLVDPDVAAVGGIRLAVADTATGKAIASALSSKFGVGNSINHYADVAQDTDHASFGIYRRSVAQNVGGWDENLPVNEDVDFDHRIRLAGHRIRFDPAMEIHWQVRESLSGFARQYRRYGRGKAAMVRKNGSSAVRIRHLAAPALVGLLFAAGASALIGHRRAAAAAIAPYVVAIAAATARTTSQQPAGADSHPMDLAMAFITMHVSWGVGFLEGLVLRRPPAPATAKDPSPRS